METLKQERCLVVLPWGGGEAGGAVVGLRVVDIDGMSLGAAGDGGGAGGFRVVGLRVVAAVVSGGLFFVGLRVAAVGGTGVDRGDFCLVIFMVDGFNNNLDRNVEGSLPARWSDCTPSSLAG